MTFSKLKRIRRSYKNWMSVIMWRKIFIQSLTKYWNSFLLRKDIKLPNLLKLSFNVMSFYTKILCAWSLISLNRNRKIKYILPSTYWLFFTQDKDFLLLLNWLNKDCLKIQLKTLLKSSPQNTKNRQESSFPVG